MTGRAVWLERLEAAREGQRRRQRAACLARAAVGRELATLAESLAPSLYAEGEGAVLRRRALCYYADRLRSMGAWWEGQADGVRDPEDGESVGPDGRRQYGPGEIPTPPIEGDDE